MERDTKELVGNCVYTTQNYMHHVFALQVGAVIVRDKTVLSQGYNCMPKGCESLPWSRQGNTVLDTKYPYGECVMIIEYWVLPHKI